MNAHQKKDYLLVALSLCMLLAYSCKNTNSPQSVTEKFLTSFSRFDIEITKSLSNTNTWEMLDIMADFAKEVPEEHKQKISVHLTSRITDTQKESDSTVEVSYTTTPKFLPFNILRLFKQQDID